MGFTFGFIGSLETTQGTVCFLAVIAFVLLAEFLIGFLEHLVAGSATYNRMIQKIYKELMLMGIISFIILMYEADLEGRNAVTNDIHTWILAIDFGHIVLFFTSIFYVMHSFGLMILAGKRSKEYFNMFAIPASEVIHRLDEAFENPYRKFQYYMTYWPVCSVREIIEFKLMHKLFATSYTLPNDFNFALYLSGCLESYALRAVDIGFHTWLALAAMVLLNYLRVSLGFVTTCGEVVVDHVGTDDHQPSSHPTAAPTHAVVHLASGLFGRLMAAAVATDDHGGVITDDHGSGAPTDCTLHMMTILFIVGAYAVTLYVILMLIIARIYEVRLLHQVGISGPSDYTRFLAFSEKQRQEEILEVGIVAYNEEAVNARKELKVIIEAMLDDDEVDEEEELYRYISEKLREWSLLMYEVLYDWQGYWRTLLRPPEDNCTPSEIEDTIELHARAPGGAARRMSTVAQAQDLNNDPEKAAASAHMSKKSVMSKLTSSTMASNKVGPLTPPGSMMRMAMGSNQNVASSRQLVPGGGSVGGNGQLVFSPGVYQNSNNNSNNNSYGNSYGNGNGTGTANGTGNAPYSPTNSAVSNGSYGGAGAGAGAGGASGPSTGSYDASQPKGALNSYTGKSPRSESGADTVSSIADVVGADTVTNFYPSKIGASPRTGASPRIAPTAVGVGGSPRAIVGASPRSPSPSNQLPPLNSAAAGTPSRPGRNTSFTLMSPIREAASPKQSKTGAYASRNFDDDMRKHQVLYEESSSADASGVVSPTTGGSFVQRARDMAASHSVGASQSANASYGQISSCGSFENPSYQICPDPGFDEEDENPYDLESDIRPQGADSLSMKQMRMRLHGNDEKVSFNRKGRGHRTNRNRNQADRNTSNGNSNGNSIGGGLNNNSNSSIGSAAGSEHNSSYNNLTSSFAMRSGMSTKNGVTINNRAIPVRGRSVQVSTKDGGSYQVMSALESIREAFAAANESGKLNNPKVIVNSYDVSRMPSANVSGGRGTSNVLHNDNSQQMQVMEMGTMGGTVSGGNSVGSTGGELSFPESGNSNSNAATVAAMAAVAAAVSASSAPDESASSASASLIQPFQPYHPQYQVGERSPSHPRPERPIQGTLSPLPPTTAEEAEARRIQQEKQAQHVDAMVAEDNFVRMEEEADNQHTEVFFLHAPDLFFRAVEIGIMLHSVYLAVWATSFITIVGQNKPYSALYQLVMALPMCICFPCIMLTIKICSQLNALVYLDLKVIGDVLEEQEDMEILKNQLRERIVNQISSLTSVQRQQRHFVHVLFWDIDTDKSNTVDIFEFRQFLKLLRLNYSEARFHRLFRAIDIDGDLCIGLAELDYLIFPELYFLDINGRIHEKVKNKVSLAPRETPKRARSLMIR